VRTIGGPISPKSVVASGRGLVFAQNMMYRHTVTVYDADGNLVSTIPDTVRLSDFGYPEYPGTFRGAPVEAAFGADGSSVYVSNYAMSGPGFDHPGDDKCSPSDGFDSSYLYRIALASMEIDQVIAVGSVPKYVAVTPDGRYVLASNWCSYDLSVADVGTGREISRVRLGAYPRGIAVDARSTVAYVAVMGSYDIAKVSLSDFTVSWIRGVGNSPRHVVLDPHGRYLYATTNGDGRVVKIDLSTERVTGRVTTGQAPRSMAIAPDGASLYVVNYESKTVTKLRAADLRILQTVETAEHTIGITYDRGTDRVWVACYSGSIMVFDDR
jgi:YVTN family beta-propeller protein